MAKENKKPWTFSVQCLALCQPWGSDGYKYELIKLKFLLTVCAKNKCPFPSDLDDFLLSNKEHCGTLKFPFWPWLPGSLLLRAGLRSSPCFLLGLKDSFFLVLSVLFEYSLLTP